MNEVEEIINFNPPRSGKTYILNLEQQLQAYKDKEDKLIKWCYEHGQAIDATDILDIIDPKILNEGSDK